MISKRHEAIVLIVPDIPLIMFIALRMIFFMEITSFFSSKIIDESIKWILHDVKMQQSELPTLVINQNREGFHPKVTQTSHPDIDTEVQINESRTRLEGKDPTSRSIFVLQVFILYPSSVAVCVCMCVCLDDTLS